MPTQSPNLPPPVSPLFSNPPPKQPTTSAQLPPEEPEQKHSAFREVFSILGVLVSALLLALVLINFVFQSYQVEGPSMQKTLENRDHLIVWKLSKTVSNVLGKQYVPNRGDVIIFTEPLGSACNGAGKQLIKRVVGLPGERVTYRGAELTVYENSQATSGGFNPDKTLPYGDKIINERTSNNADFTLANDEVFVAGDNRDNSTDSRCFGPLKTELITGKLLVRVLPLNQFKLF